VCHILQDGQTSADIYPTIECAPRLLRVQAGTMQAAPPGVVELWQLDILLAGERLLLECTDGRHGVYVVPSAACLKLFKRDNPDFSAKSFLRDSEQPPVNSGREFQPVSERRHIRLVLDKCSDWYPIQFVQTNYSAPTEHISFVRLFIYRANFLIEWFIINILAAHDLPPNKPLQGVLDLQVKFCKKNICSFLQLLFEHV